MKYLYKYPQAAFPYDDLVETNRQRGTARAGIRAARYRHFRRGSLLRRLRRVRQGIARRHSDRDHVVNRGPEAAELQVVADVVVSQYLVVGGAGKQAAAEPGDAVRGHECRRGDNLRDGRRLTADRSSAVGQVTRYLYCDGSPKLLFTENETNAERIFGTPNPTPYVKDSINDCVVGGRSEAVNSAQTGTKVAAQYAISVGAGATHKLRLRLSDVEPAKAGGDAFGAAFGATMAARRQEADDFYAALTPPSMTPDAANVMRQALAGMMWGKQFYVYDLDTWMVEHGAHPYDQNRRAPPRNDRWHHMFNADIISMPDKWEYPWYAAWDLAFQVLP